MNCAIASFIQIIFRCIINGVFVSCRPLLEVITQLFNYFEAECYLLSFWEILVQAGSVGNRLGGNRSTIGTSSVAIEQTAIARS